MTARPSLHPFLRLTAALLVTSGCCCGRVRGCQCVRAQPDRSNAMSEMRVLTVRHPWAWAIIHGGKDVENRVRNIAGSYRGPVAIHVAGKYAETGLNLDALDDAMDAWCMAQGISQHRHPWQANVGKIIGVVDLRATHQASFCIEADENGKVCSQWAEPNGWHLELENPRPFSEPIPFKGALSLRRLLPETVSAIEGRL
jgi:hypothetical protein